MKELAAAINRVADALFACAKEQKRQTRIQQRNVELSEEMLSVQLLNMKVTRQLESRLAFEGTENAGSTN